MATFILEDKIKSLYKMKFYVNNVREEHVQVINQSTQEEAGINKAFLTS